MLGHQAASNAPLMSRLTITAHCYSNFRECTEAEEKLNVALQYVLVIVVKRNINYICTMVNAIKSQCNLKGNYTRKSYTKLR